MMVIIIKKIRVGYPCINTIIGCTPNSTFRIANYSEKNMIEKITNNITCLEKILNYNKEKKLLFFRISSDIIPFASHPVCTFNWKKHFKKKFIDLGKFIQENDMRISMHPDQFVLINALKKNIVKKSIAELKWHCKLLNIMGLDSSAKVQIHVGGVYKNKENAIERFIQNYKRLPYFIKKRLAVENDDRNFSLKDCLFIYEETGIPVVFDSFHHECLNNGESIKTAMESAFSTWKENDGPPMVDYSSQQMGAKKGTHTTHINIKHFKKFIEATKDRSFDIMLEIKDKEKSAIKALQIISHIDC